MINWLEIYQSSAAKKTADLPYSYTTSYKISSARVADKDQAYTTLIIRTKTLSDITCYVYNEATKKFIAFRCNIITIGY